MDRRLVRYAPSTEGVLIFFLRLEIIVETNRRFGTNTKLLFGVWSPPNEVRCLRTLALAKVGRALSPSVSETLARKGSYLPARDDDIGSKGFSDPCCCGE